MFKYIQITFFLAYYFFFFFKETLGVPVITYGKSKNFPAFFTPNSGHMVKKMPNDFFYFILN